MKRIQFRELAHTLLAVRLAALIAIASLLTMGCEPGHSHDHGDHGHGHHGHSHGHPGHSHHGHGHEHTTNDPNVLHVAFISSAAPADSAEPAGDVVEAEGGHLVYQAGLADGSAVAAAIGEASRFCDAVVLEVGDGMSGDAELSTAIREAGLRGVRVVVIGEVEGQAGIDFVSQVSATEAVPVPPEALRQAALAAAVAATSADTEPPAASIVVGGVSP